MNDCDHITELSVYSPRTEYKDQWGRNVDVRVVKLFFNENSSVYTRNDKDEAIILEGRWEIDNDVMGLNYAVENCKYCPKCGKNIEPKVTKGDTA